MNDLVTIGIPTYNRLNYLQEAVASALAQTYSNIEIIISQNPYKDKNITQSINQWCQEIANQNPQVRYQLNPQNNGSPANFNAIAHAARGEYIAFIGDDDRLLPNFVETLMGAIKPGINLAFSKHYLIDREGKRLQRESDRCIKKYRLDRFPSGEVNAKIAAWQASISFFASLFRTKDFQRIGFREDIGTPDWEFFILLAQENPTFAFIPDYLSEVRRHEQNATSAGLHFELLVPHILPISVDSEIEPYKRELLSPLMIDAVNCCLLNKEIDRAKEYIDNNYYPRKSFKGLVLMLLQKLCCILPKDWGYKLHKSIYVAKKRHHLQINQRATDFSLFAS